MFFNSFPFNLTFLLIHYFVFFFQKTPLLSFDDAQKNFCGRDTEKKPTVEINCSVHANESIENRYCEMTERIYTSKYDKSN